MVCGLPWAALPALSVAEIVNVALYVLAANPVVLALTVKLADCPLLSMFPLPAIEIFSQEALGAPAAKSRGQAQLPVTVINNVWEGGLDPPCTPLNARELDDGSASVQGGCTTRLTDTT